VKSPHRDPDQHRNLITCCYSQILHLEKFIKTCRQLFEYLA